MTPIIAPKIKEESFLISPDYFWDPQVPNFILRRQINRPVHIQLRRSGRLSTMTRYEASTNIIRKSNKTLWGFRILLLWNANKQIRWKKKQQLWQFLWLSRKKNVCFKRRKPDWAEWKALRLHWSLPKCSWMLPILHPWSFQQEQL